MYKCGVITSLMERNVLLLSLIDGPQSLTHNPCVCNVCVGASGSLKQHFHVCFQTIFSLSSLGRRRSLPLMRNALIKPSGFQRTLTTWTD